MFNKDDTLFEDLVTMLVLMCLLTVIGIGLFAMLAGSFFIVLGAMIVLWVFYKFFYQPRPSPPENLTWSYDMIKAQVRLDWTLSADADVVSQHLDITKNGEAFQSVDLEPNVNFFELPLLVNEFETFHAELTVFDGNKTSVPAVADFVVPKLNPPVPPTDLVFSFEEVDEPEA